MGKAVDTNVRQDCAPGKDVDSRAGSTDSFLKELSKSDHKSCLPSNQPEKQTANPSRDRILGDFGLSGHDGTSDTVKPLKSIESIKPATRSAELKLEPETKQVVNGLEARSYSSKEAAYVNLANKLADNPQLLKSVTDDRGRVSSISITNTIRETEAKALIAGDHDLPAPVMNKDEKKALQSAASSAISLESTLDGAAAAAVGGLPAYALHKFSSANINDFVQTVKKEGGAAVNAVDTVNKALLTAGKSALEALTKHDDDNTTKTKEGTNKPGDQTTVITKPNEGNNKQTEKYVTPAGDRLLAQPLERQPAPRVNVDQVRDTEFSAVAKGVIAKIDTEHKGYVTREQLAKALEDPQFKGKDAQALAAMYQNFDAMHNLSKHEGILDSKSITAGDLDKYNQIQVAQNQRVTDAYEMKVWAHSNLAKFDKSGSGQLTASDIEKALKDPSLTANDRTMLQTIQKHYSEMGHFYERGVNLKAFDDYAANIFRDTAEAKLTTKVWGSCYGVNQGQKPSISHDLYADRQHPENSITPDGIKQGSIGDCYFEASLAAVAKSNPTIIKNMIKDNGNGTYTVTFPGAKGEPITVKAPTEAEQGLYNHGSAQGLWASVVEKAYGEYCQKHFWRRSPFNLGGGNTPEEGADGGGRTAGSMKLLTGSDTSTDMLLITSQATVARNLEAAFSGKPPKSVTAGINNSFFGDQTDDKFYVGHAYSITGFKPDGKGGGMVTIRNPWGGKDGTTDGTITVPLATFLKNFSDVTYEK